MSSIPQRRFRPEEKHGEMGPLVPGVNPKIETRKYGNTAASPHRPLSHVPDTFLRRASYNTVACPRESLYRHAWVGEIQYEKDIGLGLEE